MQKAKDPSQGPSLNLTELLSRVDNDRELLRDLLSIFEEDFRRHLRALQEAVQRQDTKEVAVVSHTLKGMLSNLAVNRAATAAGHLDNLLATEQRQHFPMPLQHLKTKCAACYQKWRHISSRWGLEDIDRR